MRKIGFLSMALLGMAACAWAEQNPGFKIGEVEVIPVQGEVYLIAGAGGNIVVQVGEMGVAVVDTGNGKMTDQVLDAIRRLSNKPLQYIINTHYAPDYTGGNDAIRKAGVTITGANVTGNLTDARNGAQILAHNNVLDRMSAPTGQKAPTPAGAWPTDTYVGSRKDLFFNDEPIELLLQPHASTDGDSLVFFRHSDVVCAGDILLMTSYPVIDVEKGGSVEGEIAALNRLLDIAVPRHEEEGGTYIVPGKGRVIDEFDLVEYRDMVVIVRDRVRAAIKKGMTLAQIKDAHYTKDWDPRYDVKTGEGSAIAFVEAVYKSLMVPPKK